MVRKSGRSYNVMNMGALCSGCVTRSGAMLLEMLYLSGVKTARSSFFPPFNPALACAVQSFYMKENYLYHDSEMAYI